MDSLQACDPLDCVADQSVVGLTKPSVFTSPPMPIYIEDTDAYGVKYNANYMRTYERAMHQAQLQEPSLAGFPPSPHWSIVQVGELKFKQAPTLGQEFLVKGEFCKDSQAWNMTMLSPDGATVYSTATNVKLQSMTNHVEQYDRLPSIDSSLPNSTFTIDTFTTFRDEFDPQLPRHLPLFTVLKLFERARTNWIGGPNALNRMKTEDGVVYVVTTMTDLKLLANDKVLSPGDCPVTVHTEFCSKKGGMVVDCMQTVSVLTKGGYNPIAQGKVTIMGLNSTIWRPTKKLPDWLLRKL
ncbi:hypothetical protein MPSEU_000015600 [Mayamaea pseudoterrestris]|nr:hypothetical protein MPSEU_000015600 [Mayamaea pseudoterrestris]